MVAIVEINIERLGRQRADLFPQHWAGGTFMRSLAEVAALGRPATVACRYVVIIARESIILAP